MTRALLGAARKMQKRVLRIGQCHERGVRHPLQLVSDLAWLRGKRHNEAGAGERRDE